MIVMAEQRMSADERRALVVRAATAAFADGGYEGTSTEDIARRAGISQPYIFRLFGSKKDLFVEVVNACFGRTVAAFEKAAEGLEGPEALEAMGAAYSELVRDPELLLVEMHAFTAAVHDDRVREVARDGMRLIWQVARRSSGAGPGELQEWLAMGMLMNVVAALGLEAVDEGWARDVACMSERPCTPEGPGMPKQRPVPAPRRS